MRLRSPWTAAAALAAAAGLLLLCRPRHAAPAPPPSPAPPLPAAWVLVAGEFHGPRVARRALLAFPDGLEVVLQEGSVFRAERSGDALIFHLDEGRLFADGGGELRVITPHATASALASAFDVEIHPRGVSVTSLHGAVLVAGRPFQQEISRGEALDVAPAGTLGPVLTIDPTAVVAWAREAMAAANRVRDGGFEEEFARWDAPSYPDTAVKPDKRARSGRRAALVVFNAVADYRHASPRSAPFDIPPGSRLRFGGYAEVTTLEAGPEGGAFVELRDGDGVPVAGARSPLHAGAAGWRKFSVEIDVPSGLRGARVVCTKADNGAPIIGSFRLDDLSVFVLP